MVQPIKANSEAAEKLAVDVHRVRYRAALEEKSFHEAAYDTQLMITLTFKNVQSYDRAVFTVQKWIEYLSFKILKRHSFVYGWFDVQPNRGQTGQGSVLHFHLFLEIDGGLPDGMREMIEGGKVSSGGGAVDLALIQLLSWVNPETKKPIGNILVELYDDEQGRIPYSAINHGFYFEYIGCPHSQHSCRKHRQNQDKCLYRRDRQRFHQRHQRK